MGTIGLSPDFQGTKNGLNEMYQSFPYNNPVHFRDVYVYMAQVQDGELFMRRQCYTERSVLINENIQKSTCTLVCAHSAANEGDLIILYRDSDGLTSPWILRPQAQTSSGTPASYRIVSRAWFVLPLFKAETLGENSGSHRGRFRPWRPRPQLRTQPKNWVCATYLHHYYLLPEQHLRDACCDQRDEHEIRHYDHRIPSDGLYLEHVVGCMKQHPSKHYVIV